MAWSNTKLLQTAHMLCVMHSLCYHAYRSHFNVGRFLYKVGTLRNFANDLLRKIIITTLIS